MTERMLVSTTETTYGYVYDGGQLRRMTVTTTVTADEETTTQTETLSFTYDASGAPQTVTCGNTTYLYVTNLQGDVVAILDDAGNPVVQYSYDAWGKLLTTNSIMAGHAIEYNPLRYRGYVYDTETEFYYLQSRYYDPELGRFLNADALVSTGQGLLGNNMFAYCRNNPVCRFDTGGAADMDAFDADGNPATEERDFWGKQSGGKTSSSNGPSITYLGGKMYPNSGGRHGGTLHRALIDSLRYLFKAFGYDVSTKEERVYYDGSKYRYPDLIVRKDDEVVAYIQVGKSTQSGNPVARESRAIMDLEKTGIPVLFYPYDD